MVTRVRESTNEFPVPYDDVAEAAALANSILNGSAASVGDTIAAGRSVTRTVTVTGAAVGDFAVASFSVATGGLAISASVTAANTVTVVIANVTAAGITIAVGTVHVRVFKKTY
jgi:hypothetical protein